MPNDDDDDDNCWNQVAVCSVVWSQCRVRRLYEYTRMRKVKFCSSSQPLVRKEVATKVSLKSRSGVLLELLRLPVQQFTQYFSVTA